MGKSLAEVHALERARWDALVPARFDPASDASPHAGRSTLAGHLLAGVSDFLGPLRGRRVVEYGCGLGDLTLRLAREGAHVTAVDLSPRSIDYVRQRALETGLADAIEAHVAAAERLPFFDESFDLALGHAVLRCVVPELGAPELHRVLKPRGRAVFSEPLRAHRWLGPLRGRAPSPHSGRDAERALTQPDLEPWSRGFSSAEVRCLELPSEPGRPSTPGWWQRTRAAWLARLPQLRRDYAVLLLTR